MPPKHAALTDSILKFVFGFSVVGGVIWKGSSMMGGDHHDHEALERTPVAKEAER